MRVRTATVSIFFYLATQISALEIIEADFTDSVSLILLHLQQEQGPSSHRRCHSTTISEEGTVDDLDEDEDIDDNESIAESNQGEKPTPAVTRNSLPDSKPLLYSDRSLASSTSSVQKFKINPVEKKPMINQRKANLPTPAQIVRKSETDFLLRSVLHALFSPRTKIIGAVARCSIAGT